MKRLCRNKPAGLSKDRAYRPGRESSVERNGQDLRLPGGRLAPELGVTPMDRGDFEPKLGERANDVSPAEGAQPRRNAG